MFVKKIYLRNNLFKKAIYFYRTCIYIVYKQCNTKCVNFYKEVFFNTLCDLKQKFVQLLSLHKWFKNNDFLYLAKCFGCDIHTIKNNCKNVFVILLVLSDNNYC